MFINASRETTLLLSATAYLEQQWYRSLLPCVALQISRNYRLLQSHTVLPDLIDDYQQRAKKWLSIYERVVTPAKRAA